MTYIHRTRSLTERDYWATPVQVVESISKVMGSKPAADLAATPENAKAYIYFTEEDDLLSLHPATLARKFGRRWVWLNPPYSRGNLPAFTEWANRYVEAGGEIVLLMPTSHGTNYFQKNVRPYAKRLLLAARRIKFVAPDGVDAVRAPGDTYAIHMTNRNIPHEFIYFDVD